MRSGQEVASNIIQKAGNIDRDMYAEWTINRILKKIMDWNPAHNGDRKEDYD
jgi:hypothetical protein